MITNICKDFACITFQCPQLHTLYQVEHHPLSPHVPDLQLHALTLGLVSYSALSIPMPEGTETTTTLAVRMVRLRQGHHSPRREWHIDHTQIPSAKPKRSQGHHHPEVGSIFYGSTAVLVHVRNKHCTLFLECIQ